MATKSNTDLIEQYFKFSLKTDRINDEYLTPEFELSGIPWKIKVTKNTVDDEDMINVFLQCSPVPGSNGLDWSCEAQATIKLLSDNPDHRTYQKTIPKTEFKKGQLSAGLTPFIKRSDWIQFERGEERGGKLYFDIHVSANPAIFFTPSEIEQTRQTFRFTVKDISKLIKTYSAEVVIRGNTWRVLVLKRNDHLGIFLSDNRNAQNENWTWKTKCSFKLLSFAEDIHPFVRLIQHTFHHNGQDWGFGNFMSWDKLMKESNKYVSQDKAVFEIDLEVEPPKPLWNIDCGKPETGVLECSICLQSVIGRDPTATKCGHLFCGACIKRTIEERKKCPLCNVDGSPTDLRPLYLST